MTNYEYTWNRRQQRVKCNRGTACQRSICRIDKKFAIELKELLNGQRPSEFVQQNAGFTNAFESGLCHSHANPIENLRCCGPNGARFPYDADSQKCCRQEIFSINDADATC